VWLRVTDRLESFQMHIRWAGSDAGSEKGNDTESEREMLLKLLPMAFLFMALVLGASTVHFPEGKPIEGHLFPITAQSPVVWPLASASTTVEARIHIQSSFEPGGGEHGGHRRSGPSRFKSSFLHNDHKWNRALRCAAQ
jgi:hypothetical protein